MDDRNFKKTYACGALDRALNGFRKWSVDMSIDANTPDKSRASLYLSDCKEIDCT